MTQPGTPRKKQQIKLPDLTPAKDVKGGTALHLGEPPLPIPPPGFIDSGRSGERRNGTH
jgi:hypothetical protein